MNGSNAQKLLEKMRNSPNGWGQTDFEHLFAGFKFVKKERKKHTLYRHPEFLDLQMYVPRHTSLKEWVARDAVKLVDELISRIQKLEESSGNKSQNT